jgi:hypothetical protein
MSSKGNRSDEERIRQLDAKYGTIVGMIQGDDQKHVVLLPKDLSDDRHEVEQDFDVNEGASHEEIRRYTGPDALA